MDARNAVMQVLTGWYEHYGSPDFLRRVTSKFETISAKVAVALARSSTKHGPSDILRIGLESILIEKKHPWNNLKDGFVAETDPVKQASLRRQSIMADYILGSVHAVTTNGEIVIASATCSRLAPYGFSSQNVIWGVGAQKIVSSIEYGIRRIEEYIFPHEVERMREMTNGARAV